MSRQSSALHKYLTYDNSACWSDHSDDFFLRTIASKIITQAVDDWVYLIHVDAKDMEGMNAKSRRNFVDHRIGTTTFTEIRAFFRSQYGEMLCEIIDLSPRTVIGKLEEWLRDYRETSAVPKRTYRVSD